MKLTPVKNIIKKLNDYRLKEQQLDKPNMNIISSLTLALAIAHSELSNEREMINNAVEHGQNNNEELFGKYYFMKFISND